LRLFDEHLAAAESPERREVQGLMIVEDWQTDLKKVTLRVLWTNLDGSPYEFSQSVYLHRQSEYGGG